MLCRSALEKSSSSASARALEKAVEGAREILRSREVARELEARASEMRRTRGARVGDALEEKEKKGRHTETHSHERMHEEVVQEVASVSPSLVA